jgi:hypothetical protein
VGRTRVFVSFDYDHDKRLKDAFVAQSRNPDSPFEIADWSMKEAAPEWNWEVEASKRIKQSDVVVVVLGFRTYCASGVKKEVQMARENQVRVFQLKPLDSNPILVVNAGVVYEWTWLNLKRLLGSPYAK